MERSSTVSYRCLQGSFVTVSLILLLRLQLINVSTEEPDAAPLHLFCYYLSNYILYRLKQILVSSFVSFLLNFGFFL
jgi:hypothetical protein